MNTRFEAPLFRGATKPVMFIGVPINALVAAVLPSLLATMLTWEFLGFVAILFLVPAIFAVFVMRQMTKRDDQYLNMWLLELQERSAWINKNKIGEIAAIPPKALRHQKFIED